jgi:hypothetical protein
LNLATSISGVWSCEQLRSGLRRASPCPVRVPVKLPDAAAKRPVPRKD